MDCFSTSYVKLQEAYFSESNAVGSWVMIGYKAPSSGAGDSTSSTGTNFAYSQQGTYTNGTITTTTTATAVWQAKNTVVLNDCAVSNDNVWQVKATISNALVTFDASTSNNCKPLTPTFDKIGK